MARICTLFLAVAVLAAILGAQETIIRDPHTRPPRVGEPAYVRIDDMLLAPEQITGETSRTQAALLDFRSPNGYWDFGVIPYSISPDFTEEQRSRIVTAMQGWMRTAPIVFVPRTNELGFLDVTKLPADERIASPCYSAVGQHSRSIKVRTNLGDRCADSPNVVHHELGHALGLFHEQSRADRDDYVEIDMTNVQPEAIFNFQKLPFPVVGPYDFTSIMHYRPSAFALDPAKPVIIPRPGFGSFASVMGRGTAPSQADHDGLAFLYNGQLRPSAITRPTEASRRAFNRDEFIGAMERLNAFYLSRFGLQRPGGLSIDGRPDFVAIAQWIFDVYLGARSSGWSTNAAFDIVTASITRTDEWRHKNPSRAPLTPAVFQPSIVFDRGEFLGVLQRLDTFYRAPEGLQRPNGLSLDGGPDYAGIATWVFEVYLRERLGGTSAIAAWVLTENAIKATDEWRRKH